MTRRLLGSALVVAGSGALAATASSAVHVGSSLQRPLHLPRLASGTPCPVSRVPGRVPFARRYGTAPGIGPGPVYPILGSRQLRLEHARVFHSHSWAGAKVLWLVLPSYRGPVLIRGARLDRPGRVRFQDGNVPPLGLRVPLHSPAEPGIPVPKGTRYMPSATRLRGPGCYAYQIDGTSFSRVVVFHAVWSS